MIVVFALLALLLTLAVPRYMKSEEAARHKVREQNMSTVRDAIDKFKADQGRFPASLDELVSKRYLRQVPVDPVTASTAWRTRPSPVEGEAGVFDLEAPATPVEQAEPAAPLAAPPATTPVAAPAASNS